MLWANFLDQASQLSFSDFSRIYSRPAIVTTAAIKPKFFNSKFQIGKMTRTNLLMQNVKDNFENNRIYFLNHKITVIGREAACDIILDFDDVSRQHAKIKFMEVFGGKWVIDDCCSTNGTYVNNQRIRMTPHCLEDFDTLRFGKNITSLFMTLDGLWQTIEANRKQLLEACFL